MTGWPPPPPAGTSRPDRKDRHARKTKQRGEKYRRKIREYIDWVDRKPFRQTTIQLYYDQRGIAQIEDYIYTEKGEKDHQE